MSEETKLLPCPFCNGEPVQRETVEHYAASADGPAGCYSAWVHIGCDTCGFELGDEYRSNAIAAWNRRRAPALSGWIATSDRMPDEGTECIVWSPGNAQHGPYAFLDTWREQRECPVGFSTVSVPVGLGWDSSDLGEISHWMPLPPPPGSEPSEQDTSDTLKIAAKCGLLVSLVDGLYGPLPAQPDRLIAFAHSLHIVESAEKGAEKAGGLTDKQIQAATIEHFCNLGEDPEEWHEHTMNMYWFKSLGLPYVKAILKAAVTDGVQPAIAPTDAELLALAKKHGAFDADDQRGLILWQHMQPGGLVAFARAVLATAGMPRNEGEQR